MNPNNKLLWIFSGTSDGNRIAKELISKGFRIKVFVATQYGEKIAAESLPQEVIETGRLSENEIFERASMEAPAQVIDATHPYAIEISKNLISFCQMRNTPYIRYERSEEPIVGDNFYSVCDVKQAAEKARSLGKQILLTIGSKKIDPFLCNDFKGHVYIRMLPDPELIEHLLFKGVPPDRIIAIQGPFSISMNRAMMEDYSIDCLVTKSSGNEGGVPQKITAAKELGLSVIVIERPKLDYPIVFSDQDELINKIINLDDE